MIVILSVDIQLIQSHDIYVWTIEYDEYYKQYGWIIRSETGCNQLSFNWIFVWFIDNSYNIIIWYRIVWNIK